MSIKKRVTVWYGVLTAVLLACAIGVACILISRYMYVGEQKSVEATAERIASEIGADGGEKVKVPQGYSVYAGELAAVIDSGGKTLYDSTGLPWVGQEPLTYNSFWTHREGAQEWLVYDYAVVRGDNHKVTAVVRACVQRGEDAARFRVICLALAAGGALFLLAAVSGGYLVISRALRPLDDMTRAAGEIERGDISKRISVGRSDEAGKLAAAFNSMLDRLEDAIKREKQFASDASHELRTPVAVIMNTCEQLLRHLGPEQSEAREDCAAMLQESGRMNRLISQLLMLTRGDTGKYRPEFERLSLNAILRGVAEELRDYAGSRRISLEVAEEDAVVEADQTLLTQMFINLMENAVKYGEPGGWVRVSVQDRGDSAAVTVEDNGVGISEKDLPHVFERFYRADRSRDRTGTGLGLSIVRWIAEIHGGSVSAAGKPGEGAAFTAVLPKRQPPSPIK